VGALGLEEGESVSSSNHQMIVNAYGRENGSHHQMSGYASRLIIR
jgi:hypothetical protein